MKNLFHHLFLYSIILSSFLILAACSGGHQYRTMLNRADSLMTTHPDSAYAIITSMDSVSIHKQRKAVRMRYELLRAEAQNKLYIPFTTDSVLRRVVSYYDRHGSHNQQLKARYLLGCAYRDLHEAPIAILAWEDAIAAADTTAADCDYATLFRVYGQMASIYYRQYMQEEELKARERLCKYALLAGDTLSHIRGLLMQNDAYLVLGDTSVVLDNIERVRHLYLERGLTQEAAQVFPSAIHIALDRGEYENADAMMRIFEKESGLFDEQGNIQRKRETYYYHKGRYYAGIGQVDSAEIQFRRLLPFEEYRVDAYHGLLFLFQYQQQTDSVAKYALLYNNAIADYLKNTQTEAVTQVSAMYDFEKQAQKAQAVEQKAKRWRIGGVLATLLTSIVALIIYLFYSAAKAEKNRKEQELQHVTDSYNLTLEHLNKAQAEALILQQSLSDKEALERLSEDKAEQVKQLEVLVEDLHSQIEQLQDESSRLCTKESKMVSQFQFIATSHNSKDDDGIITFVRSRCATNEEWDQMLEMFQECRPDLYLFLKEAQLTRTSMKICILSRYGFKNSDISTLTDLDVKYVSNARRKLAKETFHLNSAYELNRFLISKQ